MHTNITISIPKKLLEKIEKHIEGKNRSDKLRKCLVKGIEIVTSKPIEEGEAPTPSLII